MENNSSLPTKFKQLEIQDTGDCSFSSQSNRNSVGKYISNQDLPNQIYIDNLKISLRSKECYTNCPYCQKQGLTKTITKCSVLSLLCFSVSTPFIWLGFQLFRSKDLNCYDTIHYCKKCGKELGNYKSC